MDLKLKINQVKKVMKDDKCFKEEPERRLLSVDLFLVTIKEVAHPDFYFNKPGPYFFFAMVSHTTFQDSGPALVAVTFP